MTNDGCRPEILLIAPESPIAAEIGNILSDSFTVSHVTPEKAGAAEITRAGYYVLQGNITDIPKRALDSLCERVKNHNSVLLLMGEALKCADDDDYYTFCGARMNGEDERTTHSVRVFPHFLTRGLPEKCTMNDVTVINLNLNARVSPYACNAFLKDSDGQIFAYEMVYGLKGRVIVLAFRTVADLSSFEKSILTNLRFLQSTAENVDRDFQAGISDIIPFQKDIVMERPEDICRWNTLFTEDKRDQTYTHSSIFLPASPEFFRERVNSLTRRDEEHFTRAALLQSFCSIEIRNTDYCPQDCYYCYNRRNRDVKYARTVLPEEIHQALERDLLEMKIRAGHAFVVRYTGTGEPLAHPRTLPSMLAFEDAGIPTILVTNGECLDEGSSERMATSASYVRFSVDAANAETYTSIRRCTADVYGKVLDNIATVAKGTCFVGATFLVCRENFRQIYAFCEKMKRLGVRAVWIRSTDACDPFADEEMALIKSDIERSKGLESEKFRVMADQFLIYRITSLLHYKYDDEHCWSGLTKAFIQPNGDVVMCYSRPDFVIGNITEQSFSDIWGGERHIRFLRETDFSACSRCIEARYNTAIGFLARNWNKAVFKGWRELVLSIQGGSPSG